MIDRYTNRYLVQFLDERGYWVTDCAFQDGQLRRAINYVNVILQAPIAKAEAGLILDREAGPGHVVYRAEMNPHHDPPAWACGQDPYRCEDCGSLIREDLTCPRCDAADALEDRLQAIVSDARTTGGEL